MAKTKDISNNLNKKEQAAITNKDKSLVDKFELELNGLVKQQKFSRALEEVKKFKAANPDVELSTTEANVWLSRGQYEFKQNNFKQAETYLKRALELALSGETYYWMAKCLLAVDKLDEAITLFKTAFESDRLPKEYAACYLKLLFIKGDINTIEELISKKPKSFSAEQLHWCRGVLALQSGEKETAITHFKKVKNQVTPEDIPAVWIAYTQQTLGNWYLAQETLLKIINDWRSRSSDGVPATNRPVIKRLVLWQQLKVKANMLPRNIVTDDRASKEITQIIKTLELIDSENFHEAAHAYLKLERSSSRYPELATIYQPLMILAGQQAMRDRELDCTETFWKPLAAENPLNPQLVANLIEVFDMNSSYRDRQQLLTRFLKWVEQESKKNRQEWPDERLKPTLAKIHCYLADSWMAMGQSRTALGSVRQAERILPESPEVLGRKGLIAYGEDRHQEAIELLTKALENGCRNEEVYQGLLSTWKELDDRKSFNETRRRFGKHFGDLSVDMEIETVPWIDALSTQSYPIFSRLIEEEKSKDPAIRACKILIDNMEGIPTSGGRLSLKQKSAVQQWEKLIKPLSLPEQIPVLQAIIVGIQLFAKKEKGIAALITEYVNQLSSLAAQEPEAIAPYIAMLVVKGNKAEQIQEPLRRYLDSSTQPGSALAKIQLIARYFTNKNTLLSFIDEALQRDAQNPLLLLAKATTYAANSQNYKQFSQQGFELARRLQDAKALQAFREEQSYLSTLHTAKSLPDISNLDDMDFGDMEDFIENLIRQIFGKQIPPDELRRMMPELKRRMMESMPSGFNDDEDDDDDIPSGFPFPFGPQGLDRKKTKRRRR